MNLGIPLCTLFYTPNDGIKFKLRLAEDMNRIYYAEQRSLQLCGYKQFIVRPVTNLTPELASCGLKIKDINLRVIFHGKLYRKDGTFKRVYLLLKDTYPYEPPYSFTIVTTHHKWSDNVDCLPVTDYWKKEYGIAFYCDWFLGTYMLVSSNS